MSDRTGTVEDISGKPAGTQSIGRAFALLRLLAQHGVEGCSLSTLAAEAILNVPTAHRILQALVREGAVRHDGPGRTYRIGGSFFQLADAARENDLRIIFRPILDAAAHRFDDSIYLSIICGADVVCIDRATGGFPIRAVPYDIGARRPLGIGAAGIVALAAQTPQRIAQVLRDHASDFARYGLTPEEMAGHIEETRKIGYCHNQGLFIDGVSGLGVPVFDGRGHLLAVLSVIAISSRLDEARRGEMIDFFKGALREVTP